MDDALKVLASAADFGSGPEEIGRWLAAGLRVCCRRAGRCRARSVSPRGFMGMGRRTGSASCTRSTSPTRCGRTGCSRWGLYTPGSAGTVQEVFQDYTQNHYGSTAPMVFLGKDFWTTEVPAATLVQQLAGGREAEQWILITDDPAEAVDLLERSAADSSQRQNISTLLGAGESSPQLWSPVLAAWGFG